MKFVYVALIASVAAQADWAPCTKQDCTSKGWICCDAKEDGGEYTGTMICTDPSLRGKVPTAGANFAGWTYHCTTDQHKSYIDTNGGADAASSLVATSAAVALSAYMLA